MTANSELEAAIAAGLNPDMVRAGKPRVIAGQQAFAAYREQVASLQAENARLRDALRPFSQTWAKFLTDDVTDRRNFTYWLYYFSETAENYIDIAAAHEQAAAALADVETKATTDGDVTR